MEDVEKLLANLEGEGVLVQLSSDINMDPDAEQALNILANQFPEEYPEDKKPEPVVKAPT